MSGNMPGMAFSLGTDGQRGFSAIARPVTTVGGRGNGCRARPC
jgi:hypothetical protein